MNAPEFVPRLRMKALAMFMLKYLPLATIGIAAIMLLSLQFGWFNMFDPSSDHVNLQGAGYFSAPKSYLNLLARHSPYDTWALKDYDPQATYSIYLAHPAFSVFVASWFSFFAPWTSYWLFSFFSIGVMAYCGHLIAGTTLDPLKKRLSYFILICSFATYLLLYLGNIHSVFVLGLTLIFIGVFDHTYGDDEQRANAKLLAGMLITLLTKPVALLMLPILILTKETRVAALKSLAIYIAVSFIFIALPLFNPEGIGFSRLMKVAFDFDFIRQNMNVYLNHLVVNEYMKDNSFHWLNLIAQSDFRLMIDTNFSFPVFLDALIGSRLPSFIYQFHLFAVLLLSAVIPFVIDKRIRLESSLLLLFAISLSYFIGYSIVWEYQFTSVLPVVALLPILAERGVFYKRDVPLLFCLGAIASLPSLYFLVRGSDLSTDGIQTLIRLDRIVPVYLLFWIMIFRIVPVAMSRLKSKQVLPNANIPPAHSIMT
jgi:hypothetical protein